MPGDDLARLGQFVHHKDCCSNLMSLDTAATQVSFGLDASDCQPKAWALSQMTGTSPDGGCVEATSPLSVFRMARCSIVSSPPCAQMTQLNETQATSSIRHNIPSSDSCKAMLHCNLVTVDADTTLAAKEARIAPWAKLEVPSCSRSH